MSTEKPNKVLFHEWKQYDPKDKELPVEQRRVIKTGLKYAVGSSAKVDAMLAESRAMAKALSEHHRAIANVMAADLGAPEGSLRIYFTQTGDCNVFQPEDKPRTSKAAKPSAPVLSGAAALSRLIPKKVA